VTEHLFCLFLKVSRNALSLSIYFVCSIRCSVICGDFTQFFTDYSQLPKSFEVNLQIGTYQTSTFNFQSFSRDYSYFNIPSSTYDLLLGNCEVSSILFSLGIGSRRNIYILAPIFMICSHSNIVERWHNQDMRTNFIRGVR
jgi:hypothetical protein